MLFVNARFLTQKTTGVQRYAIEMSGRLKKLIPNIRFLAPKEVVHQAAADDLEIEKVGRFPGYIWEQVELPKYLRKQGRNAVLLNLANLAPVNYNRNIVTIHDLAPLIYPRWYSRRFSASYRFLLPEIARKAVGIITVSEFSKREIAARFEIDSDKISVVYNGVSAEFRPGNREEPGNSLGKYILAVSSLDPRKNFEGIIAAFGTLDIPGLNLVIAGSKDRIFADKKTERLIRNDGRVIFSGFVDNCNLINLYRNAVMLVYPSFYEGFGLPPIEAMACGCPCVVSEAASMPEVCGDAALYCDPHDHKDIADKLRSLFFDSRLRNDLVARGLNRAGSYSWEKSARQLLAIVEEKAQL